LGLQAYVAAVAQAAPVPAFALATAWVSVPHAAVQSPATGVAAARTQSESHAPSPRAGLS
jgi:hypothetical protein